MTEDDLKFSYINALMRLEDEYADLVVEQDRLMRQINVKLSQAFTLYEQAERAGMKLKKSQVIPLIHSTTTLPQKIRYVMAGRGEMATHEIIDGLRKTTNRVNKQSIYVVLSRLAESGFLERTSKGAYILRDDNVKADPTARDFI